MVYGNLGLSRMPTVAFETAFVSGSPSVSASPELLDAVNDYLAVADTFNTLVDLIMSRSDRDPYSVANTSSRIRSGDRGIFEILDWLSDCLHRELEEAQRRLE